MRRKRIALVLAGGSARGAYEVGVVQHVLRDVSRTLGRNVRFDVLCGTSVGALNVCALAAGADNERAALQQMHDAWCRLDLHRLVRPDLVGLAAAVRRKWGAVPIRDAGLLDPRGIEEAIRAAIPFARIRDNMTRGFFDALAISTTHIQSGRTVVFVENASGKLPTWSRDPTIEARPVTIRADHALASAALPILFRAVCVDGEFHCDGGLRQNEPLSPAGRLGADAVLVVNPRFVCTPPVEGDHGESLPGPLFLLGKTLNALLLDRIDTDLARLEGINQILEAGTRVSGPRFLESLNAALSRTPERGLHPIDATLVRASQDIGKLASAYVHKHRARMTGFAGRLMLRLAGHGPGTHEADLLSYVLFDGGFARELIALGRVDACAHHDELCALFESVIRSGRSAVAEA